MSKPNDKLRRDDQIDCCHSADELIEHGKAAAEFVISVCPPGSTVELELDVEERDRYGRVLAYVWVGGEMLNAKLLRGGYAQIMTIPPNVRRAKYFYGIQKEAQVKKLGVWK